jgi:hypothetical protein
MAHGMRRTVANIRTLYKRVFVFVRRTLRTMFVNVRVRLEMFAPNSGVEADIAQGPTRATTGLMHRSNQHSHPSLDWWTTQNSLKKELAINGQQQFCRLMVVLAHTSIISMLSAKYRPICHSGKIMGITASALQVLGYSGLNFGWIIIPSFSGLVCATSCGRNTAWRYP